MKEQTDIVEQLIAYRRDELSAEDRDEIESLLEADPDLRDLQSLLERMDDLRRAEQEDPSATAAHMLAMQLFGDWLLQRRRAGQKANGSGVSSDADPVRAVGTGQAAPQTFSLDGGELSISSLPLNDETRELIGQIEGVASRPEFVECMSGNRRLTAEIDERGLFRFASVDAGYITLSVTLADNHHVSIRIVV